MHKYDKAFIIMAVLLILFVCTFTFYQGISSSINEPTVLNLEKVAITQTVFDNINSNILITAKRIDTLPRSVHFTDANITNSTGNVVVMLKLSNCTLPVNSEIIIKVPFDSNLPSGKYSINLVTSVGGVFPGPTFSKP